MDDDCHDGSDEPFSCGLREYGSAGVCVCECFLFAVNLISVGFLADQKVELTANSTVCGTFPGNFEEPVWSVSGLVRG